MRRLLLRFTAFFLSGRAEAELSREIAAHLQLLEDQLVSQGMPADEARYAARRAFGGQIEQTKERHRDARSFRWMDSSWLDLRLAVRMLVKYPGLTAVAAIGMAVAIAISTAFFAFFYAYLYSTLPLDEGDRIVALENWDVEANNEERQALHDYVLWRAEMSSIQEVGAFRNVGRNLIVPGGMTEPVRLAEITASGFRIARVPPLLGRYLLDEDERPGADAVVVIGHDVWQSRFASDPAVIGRAVRLGNTAHTIVGVMPAGFEFPISHSYWVPLRVNPESYRRGEGPAIFIFGRLAPGATMASAQAELTTIGQRSAAAYPETHAKLSPRVLPYAYPILDIQDVSLMQVALMQAIVSVLLVVVAVNVAVLIYARTATRQGELAVRTALGREPGPHRGTTLHRGARVVGCGGRRRARSRDVWSRSGTSDHAAGERAASVLDRLQPAACRGRVCRRPCVARRRHRRGSAGAERNRPSRSINSAASEWRQLHAARANVDHADRDATGVSCCRASDCGCARVVGSAIRDHVTGVRRRAVSRRLVRHGSRAST